MNKKVFLSVICLFGMICLTSCVSLSKDKMIERHLTDNNPFGVLEFLHWNHDWNAYKYPDRKTLIEAIELIKESGAGWVRMDFLWQDIEPAQNKFNFEKYDLIVNLLAENKIQVLGILDYSADWASACKKWNCKPADNKLFVNYALEVIGRYKDRIKYWEVWNEPDSSVYWQEQDGLKNYCQLLKEVYAAAKQLDPECKILNGGLANGISSVNKLYDNDAGKYFDILNLHIFESPLHSGAIKRVLSYPKLAYKIMQRNGDTDKKIWVTEIGCPGVKRGLTIRNSWLGASPNEKQQAKWVKAVYTDLINSEAVEKVFWAFFRDCHGHWGDATDYLGLVRWDFSKKPAFIAYKDCFIKWFDSKSD